MNITNSIQGQRIYPQQIQNDIFATNLLVNCDPRLKGPPPTKNELILNTKASVFGNPLNQESQAGKLAVGEEICDLTINGNLEVKGKLKLNGSIVNICNISCPEDFIVSAGRDVKLTAAVGGSIQCTTGALSLEALSGVTASCTVSVIGHLNAKDTSTSAYKPTLITSSWTGLVSLLGASTDTAGKIQLDNNAAVAGNELILIFGTPYAQAPVVQISIQGPVNSGAGQALPIISIASISNNSFTLRLDVAATGIRNDIIQYTVIGLD